MKNSCQGVLQMEDEVRLAYSSGKVIIGYRKAVKYLKTGKEKPKAIIIAENMPSHMRDMILYLAKMSNVPVIKYPGKSIDLGRAVRKPFFVSTIVIIDPGESRILELAEQKEGS